MPKDKQPQITLYVIDSWGNNPCSTSSDGSCERFWYKAIYVFVMVAVSCDGLSMYRQIFWGDMTQKKISVLMKESAREDFCEVVRCVDGSVNSFEDDEVALHPVTQRKILNVNVTHAWSRFLGIAHRSTTIIVLVSHRSRLLWDTEIPKDTANK